MDVAIICARISEGATVEAACKGECRPPVFYALLGSDETAANMYARARESRAHKRFEAIDSVIADLRSGKIDAASARVEIDTKKWQCGKELAKHYADKVTAEVTGPDGAPLRVQVEYVDKPSPSASVEMPSARLLLSGPSAESGHTPLPPSQRRDLISG